MIELTAKNGDWKAALDAMKTICIGVVVENEVAVANRLPTLASLRADRTMRAINKAWNESCEKDRIRLITDLGEVKGTEHRIPPGTPAMDEFMKAWGVVLGEEQTIKVETLTLADIEAGWSRDMKTGKKGPLEISSAELGNLMALGILVDPDAKAEPAAAAAEGEAEPAETGDGPTPAKVA